MKILHLSDLHYCRKHLQWVEKAMDRAIYVAVERGCDAWVISGDSFDSTMPVHEDAVSAYLKKIVRLKNQVGPGLVLYGTQSHDHPGSLDAVRSLGGRHPVYLADKPEQVAISEYGEWVSPDVPRSKVVFSAMPSLNKADPKVIVIGAQEWVRRHMEAWQLQNRFSRENGIPTVLVTHGTVVGCKTESQYAMVSPDHEFTLETLRLADASATMLGHIHKHQSWSEHGCPIAYPGSLTRLVHGHHDKTGCLIWDVGAMGASFEFIELPARRLLEITFDGPPDVEKLAEATADIDEDTSVRVRWDVDQEHAHEVDKAALQAVLAAAGEVRLEGSINPIVSVRSPGIGVAGTLADKLAAWAKTTGDESLVEGLVDRLDVLQAGGEVEDIVRRI